MIETLIKKALEVRVIEAFPGMTLNAEGNSKSVLIYVIDRKISPEHASEDETLQILGTANAVFVIGVYSKEFLDLEPLMTNLLERPALTAKVVKPDPEGNPVTTDEIIGRIVFPIETKTAEGQHLYQENILLPIHYQYQNPVVPDVIPEILISWVPWVGLPHKEKYISSEEWMLNGGLIPNV